MSPPLAAAGLVVGFMIGLSGVGSGALMAPLLLLFGLQPAVVVGSDLLFGLLTKIVGVGPHLARRSIAWPWVALLAAGSLPGVVVGARVVHHFAAAPQTIRAWIAALLVVAPVVAIAADHLRDGAAPRRRPRRCAVVAIGATIGITVGATSVGSGSLVDVALMLFSPLAGAELVGTGIAHAVLLTAVGAVAHWSLGTIDLPLVSNLLAGSIPGVLLGGWLTGRIAPRPLRWGVSGLVLASALTLLLQSRP